MKSAQRKRKPSLHSPWYHNLQCPYCQEKLEVADIFASSAQDNHIQYGVLRCLCDEYPIVEGIIYLKKDGAQTNQQAVAHLRHNQWQEAFSCLIAERKKIKWLYLLLYRIPAHSFLGQRLTLNRLLKMMYWLVDAGSRAWYRYLTTRQNRVTFLMTLAPLALAPSPHTLVDAGCGLGYFLRYADQWTRPRHLVGLDIAFSFLYLARRFVVPSRTYLLCCDQEAGLPFTDHSVSHYYINDAFVVIKTKRQVLQELTRVVSPQGLAIITHVHNHQVQNLGQEYGVTLAEMKHYVPRGTLLATTDTELWRGAVRNHKVRYVPMAQVLKKRLASPPPAFSFVWSSQRQITVDRPTLSEWKQLLATTPIDYSEDEHLRL